MGRSTQAASPSTCPLTDSQLDHCDLMERILCTCFIFSSASVTFLMYIRVCAVYNMNKLVVLFFGITWLIAIASVATPFGALEGTHIGPTKYCTTVIKHDYIFAISVTNFANDTLILLAIVFKLGMEDIRRSSTSQISIAWKPTGNLLAFTRVFLQDSQIYYSWVEPYTPLMFLSDWSISIAVVLNFAGLITFFAASNPPQSSFRFIMIYPNIVIVNIMACRVFRNVKLGRHSQVLIMPTQINIGNLMQHDDGLGTGEENSYHMMTQWTCPCQRRFLSGRNCRGFLYRTGEG